jgi:hypothetical protein
MVEKDVDKYDFVYINSFSFRGFLGVYLGFGIKLYSH